jgi:hypothetical protein
VRQGRVGRRSLTLLLRRCNSDIRRIRRLYVDSTQANTTGGEPTPDFRLRGFLSLEKLSFDKVER